MASCVYNCSAWITGGVSRYLSKNLYRWTPGEEVWTKMAVMRNVRWFHGMLIYVIAGEQDSTVEAYNPETNVWRRLRSMPMGRGNTGAVYIFGQIIVPGGNGPGKGKPNHHSPRSSVYIYNISANTWRLSDVKMTHGQSGCRVALIPGRHLP